MPYTRDERPFPTGNVVADVVYVHDEDPRLFVEVQRAKEEPQRLVQGEA